MASEYVAPAKDLDAFHCPHHGCNVFAHQTWAQVATTHSGGYGPVNPDTYAAKCGRCNRISLWIADRMIYPRVLATPPPHDDLTEPALATYTEARAVATDSPRAAAALLRLCMQQLVAMLGAQGKDLNSAVGELVAIGLPPMIQRSMDSVRLIGNEAVHPGTIDLNDDPQMALNLFDLVNLVAETMITQPRKVNDLYDRLPESKREAIERRDS